MHTIEFILTGDYIELCNLLKLTGVADSGGQGKALVAQGQVKVDGQIELRKTAKIRVGQIVEHQDVIISLLSTSNKSN